MSEHVTLNVGGASIDIYLYVESAGSRAKAEQLASVFSRMPTPHVGVIYPIIVMNRKPGGRQGGGTWTLPNVVTDFSSPGHEANTGVPNADVQQIVAESGRGGLIGITLDRWVPPISRVRFTVMHEVGHCLHNSFRPGGLLASGVNIDDLAGMLPNRCGAANPLEKRIVEVYSNYICAPSAVFHAAVPGETAHQTNSRLVGHLRRSRAFESVPETWQPR
ncbi:MAG: hypothetical protein ABL984_09325 [Pyrinomonadaceae bacterium]